MSFSIYLFLLLFISLISLIFSFFSIYPSFIPFSIIFSYHSSFYHIFLSSPEGLAASILSLLDLRDRAPDALLPSHGPVLDDPQTAIDLTVDRLRGLLELRGQHVNLEQRRASPFVEITPHLLYNRVAHANSYVLLSDSGKALVVDYGYDLDYGLPAGTDRAARRPWLYTLPTLKSQFGVQRIDVAIPTHYHDDHVAAFNLLRAVEGTQLWVPVNFADVLADPSRYNMPCLWYEPIVADRVLPLGEPITWEEYELVLHPLPGHTYYAVAIELVVDGTKVLFTGDQHDGEMRLNYVYQNRFRISDYRAAGELYRRLAPDVLLTGHWGPVPTSTGVLEEFHERGVVLERLHRDLLPLDDTDFGAEGLGAWIRPYESELAAGQRVWLEVEVRNPAPTTGGGLRHPQRSGRVDDPPRQRLRQPRSGRARVREVRSDRSGGALVEDRLPGNRHRRTTGRSEAVRPACRGIAERSIIAPRNS